MAELSKIRKNGVDYDIKDAVARKAIEDLEIPESGVTDEQIASAVEDYMAEHPIEVPDSSQKKEILPNTVLFGDSITDENASAEWVKNISDYAKFASLANYARGYCTFTFKSDSEYNIADTSNANVGNNVIWNQFNRMKADIEAGKISAPDCVIILGGTNDAIQSKTIGELATAFSGDILNADIKTLTTLYQSVRYVCETIRAEFPLTQIILGTPLQIGNSSNDNIIAVHDAIVNAARKLSVKIIDQTFESGVYSWAEQNGDVYLTSDNVHPNAFGGKLIAQFLAREFYNKINLRASQISGDEEQSAILTGISATYTGGDVPAGTALSALSGVTVTGTYSDGSTAVITGYTLSGTIGAGSNTITVSYGGKTATFAVTGIAEIEKELLYSLETPFVGDGESTYIDTGVLLTDSDKDYSIFLDFEVSGNRSMPALLATMEDVSPWGGLFIGRSGMLSIALGSTWKENIADYTKHKFVFTHRANSDEYVYYVDNANGTTFTASTTFSNCPAIIGAQRKADGYQNFFEGTIAQCNIYGYVLSADEIEELVNSN